MLAHQFGEVTFKDVSDQYAQLALQGPKAMEILRKLIAEEEYIPKKYYHAVFEAEVAGISLHHLKDRIYRGRWRGIISGKPAWRKMWDLLLEAGKEEG